MSRKLQTFEDLAEDIRKWSRNFDKWAEEHIVPSLKEYGKMKPNETLQEFKAKLAKDKDYWPRQKRKIEKELRACGKVKDNETFDEYLDRRGDTAYREMRANLEKEYRKSGKIKPDESLDEYMAQKWSKYGL